MQNTHKYKILILINAHLFITPHVKQSIVMAVIDIKWYTPCFKWYTPC